MKVPAIVAEDFAVPTSAESERFRVRQVSPDDTAYEYEALMTSVAFLQNSSYFDPMHQLWPRADTTVDEVWARLGAAPWDHYRRSTFYYGVFDLQEMQQFAGFTVSYSRSDTHDAQVELWVRESAAAEGLDSEILTFIKSWLKQEWPIERVAYPGWDDDWDKFSRRRLVADDFDVPDNLTELNSVIRLMGRHDFLLDWNACFDDVSHLVGVMGPDEKEWPDPNITPKIHLGDLGWCEWSHYHRHFFAYCVHTPDLSRQRGCVYVHPTHAAGYDAESLIWVTREEFDKGFDEELFNWTKNWIATAWPFKKVGYPGRDTDWDTWSSLPAK